MTARIARLLVVFILAGLLLAGCSSPRLAGGARPALFVAIVSAIGMVPLLVYGNLVFARLRAVYGNGWPWPKRFPGDTLPVYHAVQLFVLVGAVWLVVMTLFWGWRLSGVRSVKAKST